MRSCRLDFALLTVARRTAAKASDVALRPVVRLSVGTHHLHKEINVIVRFTRHLFTYLVKHFQKSRLAIHV
jgi:hypothetical protein